MSVNLNSVREALVMLNLGSWGRKVNQTMKKTRVKQRMVLQNRQKLQWMQARLSVMAENEVYEMGRYIKCRVGLGFFYRNKLLSLIDRILSDMIVKGKHIPLSLAISNWKRMAVPIAEKLNPKGNFQSTCFGCRGTSKVIECNCLANWSYSLESGS